MHLTNVSHRWPECGIKPNFNSNEWLSAGSLLKLRFFQTPLSKASTVEVAPSTPTTPLEAYNKKGMDEYWASKEKEIQELLVRPNYITKTIWLKNEKILR